jgi:hypothetical protein
MASTSSSPAADRKLITRVVLEFNGAGDGLAKSPYFASVITMSIFYVAQCWLSRVVRA